MGNESNENNHALKLFIVLHLAFKSIDQVAHKHIKDKDMSITEFGVLELLYHKGKQTINQLRKRVLVASSSISYVVNELEQDGYIEKRKCTEDKRVTFIHLTDEGRAMMDSVFPEHREVIEEIMSDLSDEEKIEMAEMLKIIGKKASNM